MAFTTSYSSTGEYTNTAEARYYDGQETPVTVTDSAIVNVSNRPITPTYGLTITKTVDDATVYVNEEVTYTVVLENTGNQGLDIDFYDSDDNDLDEYDYFYLAGGATTSMAFTTSYSSTGDYTNTAEATYYDGQEEPVTVSDTATVDVSKRPSTSSTDYEMRITKTADQDEVNVGDTIIYTIIVENIEDGTLTNIAVTDDMVGLDEEIERLEEGESVTYTEEYIALEEGLLVNTAQAVDDRAGTEEATAEVNVIDDTPKGLPGLAITKTLVGDKEEYYPGDIVEFKIVVTNTGSTDLENVLVDDELVGYLDTIAFLEQGDSEEIFVNMVIPEGADDFTNVVIATYNGTSQTAEADVPVGVVVVEETVPLDVPDTGAIPMMLIYGLGALGVGTGWSIIDRKKR